MKNASSFVTVPLLGFLFSVLSGVLGVAFLAEAFAESVSMYGFMLVDVLMLVLTGVFIGGVAALAMWFWRQL